MKNKPKASTFRTFSDLANSFVNNEDYKITTIEQVESPIAIIAPHGGGIEAKTSKIAQEIAGKDFNLYLFEGVMGSENYKYLHLTSHYFDEPSCLKLINNCEYVVTIHGCRGTTEEVFLGGLDSNLKVKLNKSLTKVQLQTKTEGHNFPAEKQKNICNQGASKKGVQVELTEALRNSPNISKVISGIRESLLAL